MLKAMQVRSCAVARLRNSPSLARLDIARVDLRHESRHTKEASGVLPTLATLQQLTTLNISFCIMPAHGAAHLAALTGLTCLEWAGSGATDATVSTVLSHMPGMRELSVLHARLSDAGMSALVQAPCVRHAGCVPARGGQLHSTPVMLPSLTDCWPPGLTLATPGCLCTARRGADRSGRKPKRYITWQLLPAASGRSTSRGCT